VKGGGTSLKDHDRFFVIPRQLFHRISLGGEMFSKKIWLVVSVLMIAVLTITACGKTAGSESKPLTVGLLLVGPANDAGWSQAHFDSMAYVKEKLPGTELIYLENVYTGSSAHTQTPAELAADMASKGAKVVIFNSDDQKDNAIKFAQEHPDVYVIHASGDSAWKEGKNYVDLPNLKNIMGRMEYGKMIAGCAAALTSETGKIGFLGPLINDETRRFAASAYLGAKYCWTNYLGKDAADLEFKVTWIGFWFNIPGVTLDPTQVADDFYNTGYDVVISSIDTTEALTEAKKLTADGKKVWAIPYDYSGACEGAEDVCLGVEYFNWGPAYLEAIKSAQDGTWKASFELVGPDWADINNKDTSAVGFNKGGALSADNSAKIDQFIKELGAGLNLWTGPINLQDGTVYLKDGEVATDLQVWYLPQLLEGMEGQSE
jgi:simple sugar transport system substrate-binding protein